MLELIAGARDALNGLLAELLGDYIRMHIVDSSEAEQAYAAVELLDVIRYLAPDLRTASITSDSR